ncbi:hypothetical protein [Roseateles violae]|uniref:Uncharacterized protein n=1 Tax=Roseateles violae TaxID=3058042 RepID=A0ABT8DRI4_9BURK|nr:hypothetical protein [Pelomonas sp. PFR6]MDN3918736.1 hypothetical protein [Pelomonas sp. PFR6]
MATKKTVAPTPPQGNEFVYYIPNPPDSPADGAPPKPIPVTKEEAAAGKGIYVTPAAFIKTKFSPTSKANFGSAGNLDKHCVLRKLDLVRAALEGGYGRQSNWSSALVLNKAETASIANYLVQRLRMVAGCVELDKNNAYELQSFFERVEASEKTALSFVLGGMGAFIAAQKWLAAGGDPIRSFLHVGIFTKGIAGAPAAIAFKSGSKKVPDYLVESKSGKWHVFESKGGHVDGRWERLCEGLVQLAYVPKIGWAGQTPQNAVTCVCVHTSADPGRMLRVMAVDPPGDGPTVTEEGVQDDKPLILVEGVCRLLVMLEALEQFQALSDGGSEESALNLGGDWQRATSTVFGGLRIAVPSRYAQHEDEVRRRLAVFFAVQELRNKLGLSLLVDSFTGAVRAELMLGAGADADVADWSAGFTDVLDKLAPHVFEQDFMLRCSRELQLERLAGELMSIERPAAEQVQTVLRNNSEFVFTSGGLLLSAPTNQLREGREAD